MAWSLLLVSAALTAVVVGQTPQTFRTRPSNVSVVQGQPAVLRCAVNNKRGRLQWTKDGFALGFDYSIPGFPKYAMRVNESAGVYDLHIQNSGLDDDAEFSCQVGPAQGSPPLHGVCHLSVLIPPSQPLILDHVNGEEVRVGHKQRTVTLTCESSQGKPAANLTWWRGDTQLKEGVVYKKKVHSSKLESATSTLTFEPDHHDNGQWFTCRARNAAMTTGQALSTRVKLNVMHPPGVPQIAGYKNGTVISTGDTLILTCVSHGGNPLAQVYWYKNGKELDFSYNYSQRKSSGGNKAENELSFTVKPNDNGAIYQCRASNLVTKQPLTAQVNLTVRFAPKNVTITGHQHAKAGETITLTCETSISNPPASITWSSVGRLIKPIGPNQVTASPNGGYVTRSQIQVMLRSRDNNVVYMCIATNEELGKTVESSAVLQVMYPPGFPVISGYEGRQVMAGRILSMTCTSVGGNPLAQLTWWKGINRIHTAVNKTTGQIVSSQVSFILKANDNGAEYRCEASNAATSTPLITTRQLIVNFPPKSLKITTDPPTPKAGRLLRITCTSASSNPACEVSWWKDGNQIKGTADHRPVSAEHGGKSTTSVLTIVPGAEDDGEIYACRAMNNLLERAVSDAITLNIRYKPHFPKETPSTFNCVEHRYTIVNVTVKANPGPVVYTWYRNKQKIIPGKIGLRHRRDLYSPTFFIDDGVLNITNVSRNDAGPYTVQAANAEGRLNYTFNLNVQYPAGVTEITDAVIVDSNASPTLRCKVDANPMTSKMVTWSRPGYDMRQTAAVYDETTGVATLHLSNVTKADTGVFLCTASNGVGGRAVGKAHLIVKYAPEIDLSPQYGKAAAEKGSVARLRCRAAGAPAVQFKWYKDGLAVNTSSAKYHSSTRQTSKIHYLSELRVANVTKADYSTYTCEAWNSLGQDRRYVSLDGTSRPDEPTGLRFINRTHDSITFRWNPGFDGGSSQWFQVRYNEVQESGYKYEDVVPPSAQVYRVGGLKIATEYELTVRGINSLGEGEFAPLPIRTMTAATRPLGSDPDDTPLIIILCVSIIGMVLLGLNVLLILFFIRRRRKRLEKASDVSDSASQPNTVEMFSAPTVTEDSKSYSTYGGRSVDGDFHYDEDEMKKFMGPPGYVPPGPAGPVIDAYGPKPDYYAAPRPDELYPPRPGTDTPSPGVDPQRSLLIKGASSKEVLYPYDQRKYDPYVAATLPRSRDQEDDRTYADQLRRNKVQRSYNNSPYDLGNGRAGGHDLAANGPKNAYSAQQLYSAPRPRGDYHTPTPPPIPARVPLQATPGRPHPDDVTPRTSRYGPPPRTPPEMRGHLV